MIWTLLSLLGLALIDFGVFLLALLARERGTKEARS